MDARTGAMKWTWDPKLPTTGGPRLCCGAVNRGVALYNGLVFVGLLDGRLVALDADNGTPVWDVQTSVDLKESYSITGAPRVVKGKVIIGNGGAENAVRGYISAYDADTGRLAWRFFTVPGDPSKPFEHPELAMAAKTWTGEWWKYGGGGTAWDAMAYDPEADLLYVGTGNGGPWDRNFRSPQGGDNLFVASILASARHRPPGVALPAGARRSVGLHRDAADVAGRPPHRRPHPQGDPAGAEERLLLRLDRLTGQFISGEPFTAVELGDAARPGHGPADRVAAGALRPHAGDADAGSARRAQLAPDVVSSRHRARLLSRSGQRVPIQHRPGLQVQQGRPEPGRDRGSRRAAARERRRGGHGVVVSCWRGIRWPRRSAGA